MVKPTAQESYDLHAVCRYIEQKYNLPNAELFDNMVAWYEKSNYSVIHIDIDGCIEDVPEWFPEEAVVALQRIKDEFGNELQFSVNW